MANSTPGIRPPWVSDELFPFESRFVDLDGHTIHYVDEGEGPTLLLYHGNPTWSFLYRDLIAGLRDRFRCVAWDYPGFGLSEAAPGFGFTVAEHLAVAERFVETLDLRDVTPFVQDWGGAIGVGVATRHPERHRAFIVGNTSVWPADARTRVFSWMMGGPVGGFLIGRFNVVAAKIVPFGHRRRKLTYEERHHYTAPFPDAEARRPTHVFPHEIVAAEPLLREVSGNLDRIAHLPALIVWGDADFAFKEGERRRWEAALPNSTTHILQGAGHYIQDDAPDEIVRVISDWWDAPGGPGD